MRVQFWLQLAAVICAAIGCSWTPGQVKDGDIIFHTSRSRQSVAIQKATGSQYSHMGIIFLRNGKPYVFEAVGPVKHTPLAEWIARGKGRHYVIKRLRNADQLLTEEAVARLRRVATGFLGKPYDQTFEWSDERMYCSELVWKTYDRALGTRIGRLQKLADFNLSDAAVKAKIQERYPGGVPEDEVVVSPISMFESSKLVLVERH
jgi:uncharacterized protein YycO